MLIHTCCADCLLKFFQTLTKEEQEKSQIYFYNPNIYPREEYNSRLRAVKKVVKGLNTKIKIIVPNYLPQKYFHSLKKANFTNKPRENKYLTDVFTIVPKSKRCSRCWELRLRALFEQAKVEGISLVSSTLFSSNYQDLSTIKQIANKLSQEFQIDFYYPKLTLADRNKVNRGFYKQNYCGCLYSLVEKSREKYEI